MTRAIFQRLHIEGLTPKEIHEDMAATLQDSAPSHSVVKKCAVDFKRGRGGLEDEPRQGRPATVTTREIIGKIHDVLLTDRRLAGPYIATELAISRERVHAIVHNHREMTKASLRWLPELLGPDQKRLRCNMLKNNLAILMLIQKYLSSDL